LWSLSCDGQAVRQVGCCNAFCARVLSTACMQPGGAWLPMDPLAAAARAAWAAGGPFPNIEGPFLALDNRRRPCRAVP
jgi:hypothetical protein